MGGGLGVIYPSPQLLANSVPAAFGGNGIGYGSVQAAIDAQQDQVAVGASQAGTGIGIVVGDAGFSAADDFYNNWRLIVTDAGPNVCQDSRVNDYDGATRTFTIDLPIDIGPGRAITLILPGEVTVNRPVEEDLSIIDINMILNLGGNEVTGDILVSGTQAFSACNTGGINGGVEMDFAGVQILNALTVARYQNGPYSLRCTPNYPIGRVKATNVEFLGEVAGQRPAMGWEIRNCANRGAADAVRGVQSYNLFKATGGVTLTPTKVEVWIDSQFSGSIFYCDAGSTLNGTPACSILGNCRAQNDIYNSGNSSRDFSIAQAFGDGTLDLTLQDGMIDLNLENQSMKGESGDATGAFIVAASIASFRSFVGIGTLTLNVERARFGSTVGWETAALRVDGVDMTGTCTLAGNAPVQWALTEGEWAMVRLAAKVTGTATCSLTSFNLEGGFAVRTIDSDVDQDAAGTIVVSSAVFAHGTSSYRLVDGLNMAAGTAVTISGDHRIADQSSSTTPIRLGNSTTGGTCTISANVQMFFGDGDFVSTSGRSFLRHEGSGGTLTLSGKLLVSGMGFGGALTIVRHSGTGGTIELTGECIIEHMAIGGLFAAQSSGAGTARCTGNLVTEHCSILGDVTIIEATDAGGTVEGPPSITLPHDYIAGIFRPTNGLGTLTLANGTLTFINCSFEGLVTVSGDNFDIVEARETNFNGDDPATHEALTNTGARPATRYRIYGGSFRGTYFAGLPEILQDWLSVPASGALGAGNLGDLNAAGQAIAATAAIAVQGVLLDAAGVLGDLAICVRRGAIFVDSNPAIVAGNQTILDVATPTQQVAGARVPGQMIGVALEAAGATRVGEAYTAINLM